MKHLLLDSRIIAEVQNAKLKLGEVKKSKLNPLFNEDKPWEARFDNMYPNVIYDKNYKKFRCWYDIFMYDGASNDTPVLERKQTDNYKGYKRETALCYAESPDGINWVKPDLNLVSFEGNSANNILKREVHGAGIFYDTNPLEKNENKRYKAFMLGNGTLMLGNDMCVSYSNDGIHWTEPKRTNMEAQGDTHNNAFYDVYRGKYVAITRGFDGQRTVLHSESDDFENWTPTKEIFRGNVNHQIYSMPVFTYSGIYIGLPTIFHTGLNDINIDDTTTCELAWSYDTEHWERICPGEEFIPNGNNLMKYPLGSDYDCGCIYAASSPIIDEANNRILIYYCGSNFKHTRFRESTLNLAEICIDGFACYESINESEALIITQPLVVTEDIFTYNAEGTVKFEIFDMNDVKVENLVKGSKVRLKILFKGKLYSFKI